MQKQILNFTVYVNVHDNDNRALVLFTENKEPQLIVGGDYYHDKIIDKIDGFFIACRFLGSEYTVEHKTIDETDQMFDFCNFEDYE